MLPNGAELPSTIVLKNCHRCGQEFRSDHKDRICSVCRRPKDREGKPLAQHLSFREKQIVALICQARQNKEIAYQLHLSEGTIKEYLNRIFRKVSVKSRTELAVWSLTQARERHGHQSEADFFGKSDPVMLG
jgi:DNA-binding NarL/FixJ family response regulator